MSKLDLPRDLLAGWNIVVIDDDPDSLDVAEIILTEFGAMVHPAVNGAEGVEVVRRVQPRLVICDISMPVMDGWGVIHTLRNDPDLRDMPAIALTAHAMIGDRDRALAVGFNNYLSKPLTANTFIYELLHLLMAIPSLAEFITL
jgi:CheY-like chemotaxis protein